MYKRIYFPIHFIIVDENLKPYTEIGKITLYISKTMAENVIKDYVLKNYRVVEVGCLDIKDR